MAILGCHMRSHISSQASNFFNSRFLIQNSVESLSAQPKAYRPLDRRYACRSQATVSVEPAPSLESHQASPEELDIELPQATHTKVKTSKYVGSSVSLAACPKPVLPEFAIIGRSNVGKSSLINMLTGRTTLALTSKTPGKTVCINHFLINNTWYLVDLPGYGYAQRSKTSRLEWNTFTKEYFLKRESLAMVLLLIDGSIPPQAIDLECAMWLAESEVPFSLIFTKVDKRKKRVAPVAANVKAFCETLLQDFESLPTCIETSAVKATGRVELLTFIAQIRALVKERPARG